MKQINVKVSRNGKESYLRVPEALLDAIEGGSKPPFYVGYYLRGTPWQGVSIRVPGGDLAKREDIEFLMRRWKGVSGDVVEEKKAAPPEEEMPRTTAPVPTKPLEGKPEPTLWSVVQTEVYDDGSIKVRRLSGSEFLEAPEVVGADPEERDGSWARKFAFAYDHPAPGHPNAMIGLGGDQSPGYDSIHGENWELPLGWVLNRGSSSGRMYLSGYDANGVIIFMEFPQIPSGDPNNSYTKGDPDKVRPASQ